MKSESYHKEYPQNIRPHISIEPYIENIDLDNSNYDFPIKNS
jgi:hypothetical protein